MGKKAFGKDNFITLATICSFAGVVYGTLRAEYTSTDNSDINVCGKTITLNRFFRHVSFDCQKKEWRYADKGDTLYFSELADPLYKYHNFVKNIAKKPLRVINDTIMVKDTALAPVAYSLITGEGKPVTLTNGSYSNLLRRIKINVFMPSDSTTAAKAKEFFAKRNPEKFHVVLHEMQHDYNFINGITNPNQSPRQMIENMYHDEFAAYLKQFLAQRQDYLQNGDASCFSFPFIRKAILKNTIDKNLPLNDTIKCFIAEGIIQQVALNKNYQSLNTQRAIENARFGSLEISKENKSLQNILLNKLYTMKADGQLISFYPYFKNPTIDISDEQIVSVQEAIARKPEKPNMLEYFGKCQQQENKHDFNRRVLTHKLIHQCRN